MKKKILFFLIFMGCYNLYAMSGNQLSDFCDEKSHVDKGLCAGYVNGFIDALSFIQATLENRGVNSSMIMLTRPDGVTNGQLIKITKKYLEENPNELHYDGTTLIYNSMFDIFHKDYFITIEKIKK